MAQVAISTRLTERLQIRHPVIAAPMDGIAGGRLAAAVSSAGGLGMLGGGYSDEEAWFDREFSAAGNQPIGCGFITWALRHKPEVFEAVVARKPKAIFLSFDDPEPFASRARAADVVLFCQLQTRADAERALDCGADVIVAQGTEAGGHGGTRATFTLVPEIADLIAKRAPGTLLCAAGGIADGRGLAAVMMLGAQGALIGTRFLATPEANGRGHSKDVILNALGSQTIASKFFDDVLGVRWPGSMVRSIRNPLLDRWAQRQQDWALAADQIRPSLEAALMAGDFVLAGESAGLIHDIVPAGELVERIAREAEALLG